MTLSSAKQTSVDQVVYPAEYIGDLPYSDHTIDIGELVVRDVHGYNPAGVYVRRVSGKTDGITVGRDPRHPRR